MISFIFSKILQYLILAPGVFIVLMLIFRGFKKIIVLLAIVLYLLSCKVVAFKLLEPLEVPFKREKSTNYNIVALLGGGYIAGSKNLSLSNDSFKRFIYALEIAKKADVPIIFDGSQEEAKEIKKTAIELNKNLNLNIKVLEGKYKKEFGIYIQNRALTTIDNVKYIKEFFNKNSNIAPNIALVTSAYHMKRSLDEFSRVNLHPTPMATDFKISQDSTFLYYLPTSEGLELSSKALHEYLGLLRNSIFR